jgi:GT2 family glycosyltransferase
MTDFRLSFIIPCFNAEKYLAECLDSIYQQDIAENEYETWIRPKLPDSSISMNFSFEKYPDYLYSINRKIPFGCHAWGKYEYNTFWEKFIL